MQKTSKQYNTRGSIDCPNCTATFTYTFDDIKDFSNSSFESFYYFGVHVVCPYCRKALTLKHLNGKKQLTMRKKDIIIKSIIIAVLVGLSVFAINFIIATLTGLFVCAIQ